MPSQLGCAGGRGARVTSWEVTAAGKLKLLHITWVVAVEIQRGNIHSA